MNMNELGLPNNVDEAIQMLTVDSKESAKLYLELQMQTNGFPDTKYLLSKAEGSSIMSNKNLEMMPTVPEFQIVAATAEKELEKIKLALDYTGHFENESR